MSPSFRHALPAPDGPYIHAKSADVCISVRLALPPMSTSLGCT